MGNIFLHILHLITKLFHHLLALIDIWENGPPSALRVGACGVEVSIVAFQVTPSPEDGLEYQVLFLNQLMCLRESESATSAFYGLPELLPPRQTVQAPWTCPLTMPLLPSWFQSEIDLLISPLQSLLILILDYNLLRHLRSCYRLK